MVSRIPKKIDCQKLFLGSLPRATQDAFAVVAIFSAPNVSPRRVCIFFICTITEEKLLTELLEKRTSFSIPSHIFLRNPEENRSIVECQISYLIENVTI